MRNQIFTSFLLCLTVIGYGQNSLEKNDQPVEFFSKGSKLSGNLFTPSTPGPHAVVIVLHAASEALHDAPFYRHVIGILNHENVAVFVYDRRGSGKSEGNFSTASFEDLAQDGVAAVEALKLNPKINPQKIHLFGVSQGGWVVPIVYDLKRQDIKSLMLVASCAVTPAEQMDNGAITELTRRQYSSTVIDSALYIRHILNDFYRSKIKREDAQGIIDLYRNKPWFEFAYLPRNGLLPDKPTGKWLLEMDYDGIKYMQGIQIPVTLIWGSEDEWVPVKKSMEIWKKALDTAGNRNYKIYYIKGFRHMLTKQNYDRTGENKYSPKYDRILKQWGNSINR